MVCDVRVDEFTIPRTLFGSCPEIIWVVAFKLVKEIVPVTKPTGAEAAIRSSTNAFVNCCAVGVNVAVVPKPLPVETSIPEGAVMVTLP